MDIKEIWNETGKLLGVMLVVFAVVALVGFVCFTLIGPPMDDGAYIESNRPVAGVAWYTVKMKLDLREDMVLMETADSLRAEMLVETLKR